MTQMLITQKLIRHEGVVMSEAKFVEWLCVNGYVPAIGQRPQVRYNRIKYNRLTGAEQVAYEKKCDTMIREYRAEKDNHSYALTKKQYNYLLTLNTRVI